MMHTTFPTMRTPFVIAVDVLVGAAAFVAFHDVGRDVFERFRLYGIARPAPQLGAGVPLINESRPAFKRVIIVPTARELL